MTLSQILPHLNALMNAASAVFLLFGIYHIRKERIEAHKWCMLGAVAASAIFLIGYLTRFALEGTTYFLGGQAARRIYLSILYSHMTLAVVTVPLVFRLLFLAKKERFEEHKRLGRWTFPVWMYVSVTGIVVYLMLYHLTDSAAVKAAAHLPS